MNRARLARSAALGLALAPSQDRRNPDNRDAAVVRERRSRLDHRLTSVLDAGRSRSPRWRPAMTIVPAVSAAPAEMSDEQPARGPRGRRAVEPPEDRWRGRLEQADDDPPQHRGSHCGGLRSGERGGCLLR
jgi:hypothetical protein